MPKNSIDTELIDKSEIEIERVPNEELQKREEGIPHYKEKVELNESRIQRLKEEITGKDGWYERLKEERQSEGLENHWDSLQAQYEGEMSDDAGLEFNLDSYVTQVKVDAVTRLSLQAFLESDPKFTITPRPKTAKLDHWDVIVNRQSDYLDYKFDEEIDIEAPLRKVIHQASNLDVGIMKIPYEYMRKKRRREEHYSGKVEIGENGEKQQPGLNSFLQQYPDAIQPNNEGHWAYKELLAGKDVTFKADFMEVVYDDPRPGFVDIRDLFVPKDTEGYEGLCNAQIIIERQSNWTWWDLKKAEKNGDFENIDECKTVRVDTGNNENSSGQDDGGDYKKRKYEVIECVYWFNMEEDSEDPDDEVRIIAWFETTSDTFLGAILYPYDAVESYYVPFYIKNKKPGFYKGGMAEDLTDSHLAQNALLNFMLTEAWQQLMTTPILRKGSPIADQFLSKRWKHGVPLELDSNPAMGKLEDELTFLQKPQRAVAAQLMPVLMFLAKKDDDKTGISALVTGKESPTDPTAPAAKTAMLLEQTGINIKDYVKCLLPSFNKVGEIVLQLTYQMAQEGKPYRQRQKGTAVTGGNPFGMISRDEMVAKTNMQSRAASFSFDKINEKRENLALFKLLRGDPLVPPEGAYSIARTLVQSWSPMWKNKVDQILSDPQAFKMSQFKVCLQALGLYMQKMKRQADVTNTEPQADFKEFMNMATQMMTQAVTPTQEKKK